MNEFYEWLYESFARPRIREEAFPPDYQEMEAEWLASIESLSQHERLLSQDMMTNVKEFWGERAFAYGVQAGMMLLDGLPIKEDLMEYIISPAAQ